MIQSLLRKIVEIFSVHPRVGALEISHSSIKYLAIQGSRSVVQASISLPPGIVEHGRVRDLALLIEALKQLHQQIAPLTTPLSTVLILPSQAVYAQSFSVPLLQGKALDEAIDLNLQMLSPTRADETYYDWQEIRKDLEAGHIDLLGAFVHSEIALEHTSALKEAGFSVSAIEFPGLSLSRLIKERWENLEQEHHYLVIYLNPEGALMMILKNGSLYFNHFTPWYEVIRSEDTESLSFDRVQAFLTQEIQRVLNFYLSRSGTSLKEAILIAPMFNFEIVQIAEQKFSLTPRNLVIPELPNLSPAWFPALGAALRGLIPRSKDTGISLTEASAKTEYYQEKTISFIGLWRNIIIATFVFVFLSYLTVDIAFSRTENRLQEQSAADVLPADSSEVAALREDAQKFNTLIQLAQNAKSAERSWSPLFARINGLLSSEITLERIFLDSSHVNLLLVGRATSELAAINLKNRLEKDAGIKSVSLPLSQIRTEGDRSVSFSISIVLKSE